MMKRQIKDPAFLPIPWSNSLTARRIYRLSDKRDILLSFADGSPFFHAGIKIRKNKLSGLLAFRLEFGIHNGFDLASWSACSCTEFNKRVGECIW